MNNEWITDRLPTAKDCVGAERMPDSNQVWVMYEGRVVACPYADVVLGCPWQPIVVQKPEPYVKPRRYAVEWDSRLSAWMINYKSPGNEYGMMCVPLNSNCDEHRQAAERIAAIYEEMMP